MSKLNLQKYNSYPSFRIGQEKAIQEMIKAYETGNKVLSLNAPTASGKTLSIFVFGRVLEKEYNVTNIIYSSPQVSLVTEGNLFDLPKLVGKRNYKCLGIANYTADDCPFRSCESGFVACDRCPYRLAKAKFRQANFKATTLARYQVDPSLYLDTNVLVVDESTNLPNALLESATIELNIKVKKTRSIDERKLLLQAELKKLDVKQHLQEQSLTLQRHLKDVTTKCKDIRKEVLDISRRPTTRETKMLTSVQKDYSHNRRELDACNQALRYISMDVPYVLTTDIEEQFSLDTRRKEWTVVPHFKLLDCKVPFANLSASLDCIVLASGTPTTELLTNKAYNINVRHPIPTERRLIYYDPVGPMTRDGRTRFAKPMAQKISQLHDLYSKKTIVHAGNYQIANLINEHLTRLQNNVFLPTSSDRNETLALWMKSDDAILLSVAFEQGLNLEGPEYPINIVAKVPFPHLGDEWIQARNNFDSWYWYNLTSCIAVQQAAGRTTRNPNDMSTTYILDGSFGSLFSRNKQLFQPWFVQSLRNMV